jgi:hypothetical protein
MENIDYDTTKATKVSRVSIDIRELPGDPSSRQQKKVEERKAT